MDINILEEIAVNAAINLEWTKAIDTNKRVINLEKNNLGAHLRLGFAYLQLGEWEKAKKIYRKVIKIQPTNNVAKENLERIKILELKKSKKKAFTSSSLSPSLFLEIPGKTRTVALVNIGQKNILAQLIIGQEVILRPKKRRVEIRTTDQDYIGCLPDDLSKRLLFFLKFKSKYNAYIKEAALNRIIIFIKEETKGKKVAKYLSFPPQKIGESISQVTLNTPEDDTSDGEELTESDIEKLAETLTSEEKEYMPFKPEDKDENEDEEE